MDIHMGETPQVGQTSVSNTTVNGAVRRTPTGGPTTSDGAAYLEYLRAQRRAEPSGGLRLFNPDETPEEAETRIRETLAGLAALSEIGDDEPGEAPEIWDRVMEAIERPRLQFHSIGLDTSDS
jgi:hypothetical protein